jgi:hypothetical protein
MPGNVQTWGFLDGAALLDIQPKGWKWSPELEPLQTLMANMSAFTVPQFPAYCATLFPGEEYKCWLGQYRMPLIKSVPFFINAPQFDMFELMYDTDNVRARVMDIAACLRADASALFISLPQYRPNSAGQMAFVEEVRARVWISHPLLRVLTRVRFPFCNSQFQTGTLALIASLPHGSGVFSPTCLVHCLSGQSTFVDLLSDGTTLGASLSAWYFSGQDVNAVSSCTGFNCINACGIDLQTGLPCNMNTAQCTALSLSVDAGGSTSEAAAPAPSPQAEGIVKAIENSLTPAQQAALGDTVSGANQQTVASPPPPLPVAAAVAPAPAPSAIDLQHAQEAARQNAEQQFHDDQQDTSSASATAPTVSQTPATSGPVSAPVAAPTAAAAAQAPVSGIYAATAVSAAPAAAPAATPHPAPAPAPAPEDTAPAAAAAPAAAMATAPWGAPVAATVQAAATAPASAVVAPAAAPSAAASAATYRRLMRADPCAGESCYEQWKA